ncbi:MAG TPA: hypothetical protein VN408_18670 [Actinoplanes sp.]|nr:hypothetical protein [Actinoplanes sp.]
MTGQYGGMQLFGVLVDAAQVGSADFRARVGAEVSFGLSLYCHSRVVAGPDTGQPPGLVGLVVPAVRDSFYGGWVLTAGDVPFHVTEPSTSAEVAFIAEVRERIGLTRVGVEGTLSVADGHIVDEVQDRWDLDMNRTWLVNRIVRITRGGHRYEIPEIEFDPTGSDYLIDIEGPRS